jgi:hypothetical protein
LQSISNDTQDKLKTSILVNPVVDAAALSLTGSLGQFIAQEATAAVGHNTNQAIVTQIQRFKDDENIPVVDDAVAKAAQTKIVQTSSQISAGFAQNQKQMFSARGF